MEFELLRQQVSAVQQELMELQNRLAELDMIKTTLSEIKGNKNQEVMLPLGGGVLVNAVLKNDKVLVGVGGNVLIERDVETAKENIDAQFKQFDKRVMVLERNFEQFNARMAELEPILERLTREEKERKK